MAIFDRVKIKVEATKEFPLDIKCSLLVTKKDIEEYEKIKKLMEKREELKNEKMTKLKVLEQEVYDKEWKYHSIYLEIKI